MPRLRCALGARISSRALTSGPPAPWCRARLRRARLRRAQRCRASPGGPSDRPGPQAREPRGVLRAVGATDPHDDGVLAVVGVVAAAQALRPVAEPLVE